ncbi:hypothetical protein [Streptomyces prasinopilosus]|uniref:Integral membrane protein n=1 Tax=Streptomyces prasinopilosus TaxID=67344 RepID=A0A1G6Z5K6_9ACTN|nr:hypothetical protein SAMN05216505_11499 [Streptomyces prasinopilosus]
MRTSARLRTTLSAALVALACLLVPCGAFAAWVVHGLADTGRYVDSVAPLSADPAVRDAVADAVGDGVVEELEAGPARDLFGPFVRDAVRSFTRTEAFGPVWETGNRAVHDAVLHALRDGRAGPGPVTVDLAPVTAEVKRRLVADRMPFADRIPVEHTRVAVVPAGETAGLRAGYRLLDAAALWLPLAAVALAVAGIAVAVHRRRALTATGLGIALGGGLLAAAVAVGRRLTLADVPEPVHRPAAGVVYDALTATLRTASWTLLALGLAVALACLLTGLRERGGGPAARRSRGRRRPRRGWTGRTKPRPVDGAAPPARDGAPSPARDGVWNGSPQPPVAGPRP